METRRIDFNFSLNVWVEVPVPPDIWESQIREALKEKLDRAAFKACVDALSSIQGYEQLGLWNLKLEELPAQ